MVVALGKEAFGQEIIGKFAGLFEPIHAFDDLVVDPAVVGKLHEVVFVNDFLGDDGELDADILWSIEWRVEVEIFQFHGAEACALS